jgi:hypothetical protein
VPTGCNVLQPNFVCHTVPKVKRYRTGWVRKEFRWERDYYRSRSALADASMSILSRFSRVSSVFALNMNHVIVLR